MKADTEQHTPPTNRLLLTSLVTDLGGGDRSQKHDDWAGFGPPIEPNEIGTFGTYRVLRQVGRGGMGAVYEAIDTTLRRTVALKLMHPHLVVAGGKERFVREAQAAAALHHDNVVTLFNFGEHAGVQFLTTEFLTGSHLGEYARDGVRLGEAIRIGREVAAGLAAAHAAGVVHRDIKPDNIWIEHLSGRVRLLDFGLAWVGEYQPLAGPTGASTPGPADLRLTGAGHFLGTPGYVAPEQTSGRPADHRADLFSLGAVLYKLVTGRPAFAGRTLSELTEAEAAGRFVSVGLLRPDAPDGLADLIHQMLDPDPNGRPPSAAAVEHRLMLIGTQLLASSGEFVLTPIRRSSRISFSLPTLFPTRPEPDPKRSRWVLALLVVAAVVIASAAALIAVWPRTGSEAKKNRPTPPPLPPTSNGPVVWPPPGFTPLIGKDITNWQLPQGQSASRWSVAAGVLAATAAVGPGNDDQYLLTDREYGDFDLRLEYRWPQPGGHTTLILRGWESKPGKIEGLHLNVGDDEGFPAVHKREIGKLYETGTIQQITFDPPKANNKIGEWNVLQVLARREKIEVTLNGVAMPRADVNARPAGLAARTKGVVGLLAHWGPIEFRKVVIKKLD